MPRHRVVENASPGIGQYIKMGFGLGLGSAVVFMILTFVAMLFFIPGFIMVYKQNKLPKEQRKTGLLIVGFILMGIGMIIGLGFGAGAFFGQLGEEL